MAKRQHKRAWTGDDLLRSGEHRLMLDTEVVTRLARQLPTDFLLPGAAAMSEFRAEVAPFLSDVAAGLLDRVGDCGPGIALVHGHGLDALTDSQLTALLFGLSALLGRPATQNAEGERVVSVLDQRPADAERARGYRTNGRMRMHTDPTDVAGLLCLQQSADGGANLYVSAATVHDTLSEQEPRMLHEYYRIWGWDLHGLQRPGASPLVGTPIFSSYEGELSCRFGSSMLRDGSRTAQDTSPTSTAALDIFEDVAQRPELVLRYTLRRGESVWLNNYRVLHGRETFVDCASTGQVRHLLRTWVWLHQPPPLAPSFTEFSAAIDRG